MKYIQNSNELPIIKHKIYRHRGKCYSDTIFTFDIETTSLFKIDGVWQGFDKSIDDYSNIEKAAVPYIGMFGINNQVFYFNDMYLFEDLIKKISSPNIITYLYIQNAGFEFQFMREIFNRFTIKDMVARKTHAPIQFYIEELNMYVRCSYALTNLSLEKAAKYYTKIEKKKGDLDYSVIRSPLSVPYMSEKELGYCEYDILTLYEIIKHFKKEYGGHIKSIPLTQTGEMRRAYKEIVPSYHNRMIIKMSPHSVLEYKRLRESAAGGISKPNYLYSGITVYGGDAWDIASSYPFEMLTQPVPMEKFRKISINTLCMYPDSDYAKIYVVKLKNVYSLKFNTILQKSKCRNCIDVTEDAGRIITAKEVEITLNEIDLALLHKCYTFNTEFIEIWVARKKYLPKYFIEFLLDLYEKKTIYKGDGLTDFEKSIGMKKKQILNSAFGAAMTNIIKSVIGYYDNEWKVPPITDELIKTKLDEIKIGYNNLFNYSHGCYITSGARSHLMTPIFDYFDDTVIYYDTDSHKNSNEVYTYEEQKKIYDKLNLEADRKLLKMCSYYNIDFKRTRPVDRNGVAHPLGHYEYEGHFTEFKALRSKAYAYRDNNGELHLTLAGVGKGGVKALNDNIENFNYDTFFNYDNACKLTSYYLNDMQPITFKDYRGVKYTSKWKYGICLAPTTYTMSNIPLIDYLGEKVMNAIAEDDNFMSNYYNKRKE